MTIRAGQKAVPPSLMIASAIVPDGAEDLRAEQRSFDYNSENRSPKYRIVGFARDRAMLGCLP